MLNIHKSSSILRMSRLMVSLVGLFFFRKENVMRKLALYDPDGDVVATHWNPFDGFAVIDFDTPKVGDYKFQINRTANRDTSATLKMAWGATFN